jgi:tetratricopeptide (TPR) repeat protein
VEWKETPTGFSAFFKGMTLVDFGAPFGEEERWVSNFTQYENRLNQQGVSSLRFREMSGGVRIEGTWKFPQGPNAPADPHMESFTYRENEPARFVADFWEQTGLSVAELKKREVESAKKLAAQRAHEQIERRMERRIASQKVKEGLDDLTRFCREPLQDGKDIFLPLLPVHEKVDFVKFLPTSSPDQNYEYFRPDAKERDAQYVRLALDLYKESKWALVIRTLDFLDAEYPASPYRGDMHFLRANAMLKLGMVAAGEQILEQVRLESRGLPPALHAALYLAAKTFEKNSPLTTAETFSWLIQNYPGHPLNWLFHLAVAEALYDLEQTERANQEYRWVSEKAPQSGIYQQYRALAAFRIGDLYMKRGQYEEALGAYVPAMRQFSSQATSNPAFQLNRAEALLGLGKYEEAEAAYTKYLKEFPSYPKGWRATLRLGEIDARRPDAASQQKAREMFYETINRYPMSPGSTLARIRLIPCGDHGKFTAEAADRFFSGEAKDFTNLTELESGVARDTRYSDLRTEARIRSLVAFGKEEAAMAAISEERPNVQSTQVQKELKTTQAVLFRRMIMAKLRPSQSLGKVEAEYAALKFYEEKHEGIEAAIDPDYLLELSGAASNLGLGKLAQQFAEKYQKASSQGRTVAELKEDAKGDPGLDEKLRTSEERFAEGQALWIHDQDDAKDLEAQADLVRKKLGQVVDESRYAVQKEVILGLLEQKLKKPSSALAHAAKAELLASTQNNQVSPELLQLRGWLASLEMETGDASVALDFYRQLEKDIPAKVVPEKSTSGARAESPQGLTLLGLPSMPTLEQVLLAEAMILDRKARWGESAAVYSRAVQTGMGGTHAMYGLARALLNAGGKANRTKALSLLEKISARKPESNDDDFWRELSAKALEAERQQ